MTTYSAAQGGTIAPGSFASTELLSKVGGFIAGCGQAALAILIGATQGKILQPSDVTSLIQESVNAHVTVGSLAASGESSPDTLQYLAQQHGVGLSALDWHSALAYAGQRDVILGISNASAFGGSDSNVQGHYVTIVGTQGPNYIVSDPNTPESTRGQYVIYTPQQIANAQPFWAAVPTSAPTAVSSTSLFGSTATSTDPSQNNFFQNAGAFFATLGSWFSPPTRALKFVAGLALMFLSLVVVFFPDILAAGAAATGNPEVASVLTSTGKGGIKGGVGAGIRGIGTAAGRQRTANKQATRQAKASGTLPQLQTQRATQTKVLVQQAQARRAAKTRILPAMPASAPTPTLTPTPASGNFEKSPRVNSGKAGFGGFGLGPLTKNEPAKKPPKPTKPTSLPKVQRSAAPAEQSQLGAVARSRGESVGDFLKQPVSERKKALETYNLNARTVVTKRPIPDSRVRKVRRMITKRDTP